MIRLILGSTLLLSEMLFAQIVGADLSFVPKLQSNGAVYRSYGHEEEPLTIFYANGFRGIRLRLWHSPDEAWHGIDSVVAFAERASQEGFQLMLDIHYSDTWADPAHQSKPALWTGLGFQTLSDSVYRYTNNVIRRFCDEGLNLSSIQIGNEITAGMLWNDGRVGGIWNTQQQWNQLCLLLSRGISAVRDSLAQEQQPKIIIHVSEGANNAFCRYFFDEIVSHQVDFDIIGLSYYPWWHGSLENLQSNVNDLALRYGKEIQIVETAYPWTLAWDDTTNNPVGQQNQLLPDHPATPSGQANFLSSVLNIVRQIPSQLGTGMYYWEPAWVSTGSFGSAWENLALFDFENNSLPALGFINFNFLTPPAQTPAQFSLSAYPNPFNSDITINFELDRANNVSLSLYNPLGQQVRKLSTKNYSAGNHSITWSASDFSSGAYWIRLETPFSFSEKKVLLIR